MNIIERCTIIAEIQETCANAYHIVEYSIDAGFMMTVDQPTGIPGEITAFAPIQVL